MAKKKKKKAAKRHNPQRSNPPKSNPHKRRGARRRRNPQGGSSPWAVIGGVLGGGLIGGALDYGLAGMAATASPTRRALIFGGLTLGTGIAAAMTDGNVSGVLAGVAGANSGLAFANTGRSVALWIASGDERKAQKDDKKPMQPNADMKAVVPSPDRAMRSVVAQGVPVPTPRQLEQPRRVTANRSNLRAVVMESRG